MESGFSQSDVAYCAYTGTGLYEGKGKVEDLRLIATLYPETIHIVARKDAGIESVADLKGKPGSLDESGQGTNADTRTKRRASWRGSECQYELGWVDDSQMTQNTTIITKRRTIQ